MTHKIDLNESEKVSKYIFSHGSSSCSSSWPTSRDIFTLSFSNNVKRK